MSFNKRYLPELEVLQKYYQELGEDEFISRWIKKIDAFIGPSDSVDFINEVKEKRNNKK